MLKRFLNWAMSRFTYVIFHIYYTRGSSVPKSMGSVSISSMERPATNQTCLLECFGEHVCFVPGAGVVTGLGNATRASSSASFCNCLSSSISVCSRREFSCWTSAKNCDICICMHIDTYIYVHSEKWQGTNKAIIFKPLLDRTLARNNCFRREIHRCSNTFGRRRHNIPRAMNIGRAGCSIRWLGRRARSLTTSKTQ